MELDILKLIITTDTELSQREVSKIRGYLGNLFWDNPHMHHHRGNHSFIYDYPRVQYKVIDGLLLLIGFREGLEVIKTIFNDLDRIDLEGIKKEIVSKSLESYKVSFSLTSSRIDYAFLTHWLALNEENYEKYLKIGDWKKRKELLEKILIGNILSMAKSIGYTVLKPINAILGNLREIQTSLKGNPMLGFLGNFSVNFEIPDYFGVGKSVSRGLGTVKRVELGSLKQ